MILYKLKLTVKRINLINQTTKEKNASDRSQCVFVGISSCDCRRHLSVTNIDVIGDEKAFKITRVFVGYISTMLKCIKLLLRKVYQYVTIAS